MSYENSQSAPVQRARTNWAGALRHELSHRAEQYAVKHELPHCLSYGRSPTVCFECYGDSQHGNFLPATYKAILGNPNWRRRLQKVHSQGRKSLPRFDNGDSERTRRMHQFRRSADEHFLLSRRLQEWTSIFDPRPQARCHPQFRIPGTCTTAKREIRPDRSGFAPK